ncbi:VCBS repeat protein [Saccharothrix carnea]|uniref:VCBS repeat protein n=1 Tax=Saccharothrix carnea TaxID=1280637 RepID=A0A2P8ICH4_SACCR|nr:VCBS repeat-containing protein [Saccharothrix carnea]PSL56165.1 VCBS repeat protein [Saccharothrix carnea]
MARTRGPGLLLVAMLVAAVPAAISPAPVAAMASPGPAGAQTAGRFTFGGIGYWDADGNPDIIAEEVATGDVWMFPGNGRGLVGQAVRIGNGWGCCTIAGIGDWNGDVYEDIVGRNDTTGEVTLYRGTGKGGYPPWPYTQLHRPTPETLDSEYVDVADWNHDHVDDLIRVNLRNRALMAYRGNGGVLNLHDEFWLGTEFWDSTFAGVADWDHDGYHDFIVRDDTNGDLWLYPGYDQYRPPPVASRVRIGAWWHGFTFVDVADWDHDGHQDIVARLDSTGVLWFYPGNSTRTYIGGSRVAVGYNF